MQMIVSAAKTKSPRIEECIPIYGDFYVLQDPPKKTNPTYFSVWNCDFSSGIKEA